MISVRRAFNRNTTTKVLMCSPIGGYWDDNNQWVKNAAGPAIAIQATPIPHGDRDEGVFGEQLKANPELERQPGFMKFHSLVDMPINSLLSVYGVTYFVTQYANYSAAGFYMTIASKVQNLVLTEGLVTEMFNEDGTALLTELGQLMILETPPVNTLDVNGWP
ncbi:hypothetical protein [Pseudomonas laurylsulfatiphila]|uniref:hypothetical protein n=1 Tax=Pseudomonas laurylsulfatiphila TaxID=2011015 RepID=UPI003D1C85A7